MKSLSLASNVICDPIFLTPKTSLKLRTFCATPTYIAGDHSCVNNNTIGYTFPNTKRIWMNKKYFDKYTPFQVSDNLFHEWLHKIGFDHDAKWSIERDHSVPYALGYLVERIAIQL